MSANTVFLDKIATLRKRFLVKIFTQIILITCLLFLCLFTIAIGIEKTGASSLHRDVSFYLISILISLLISLLYASIKRESFTQALIDIDTRLDLKDRLSTAYEYQKGGKTSEFADLLIEDAGRRLSMLSNKQLFPAKFSMVHFLLILLIITNIALFVVERVVPISKHAYIGSEQSERIKALLKNYTREKAESAKKPEQESQKRLHKNMENIAKKFDEPSVSKDNLLKSLYETLKEAQGEQARLAEALSSKLEELKDVRDVPVQQIPQAPQLSAEELSKLRKMLENLLGNQLPGSIEQDLNRLGETRSLAELLEQLIDDIEFDTDAEDEADSDEGDITAQKDDKQGEDENGTQDDTRNGALSDSQQDGEGLSEQAMSGQSQGVGDGEGRGHEGSEDDEGSLSAGRGRSQDQKRPPHEFEASTGPARQDKTASSPQGEYNVHVRSVTSIGKAELPEEDVVRPYQQEVETILQKEDIPVNYREYIKNYFISIGLREEN